jgi:hypothetical protein
VEEEAAMLLRVLRRAEQLYKEVNGTYLACGPVPKEIPQHAVSWPKGSCFERLAFTPPKPVRVQLETTLDDGKLTLVARADPDGDGIPQVWFMNESSDELQGFGGD